ncbi:L-asparaginase [Rufibacter sp. DG15C]|uniref:YybH family protein n=1 Tax=Rufibacter sp. DG15C TaxID=1379909 RepID=UPI00078DBFEF|nr:DUF4440 domain-containing protein [Rufibacter sp. DG15C]AMM52159.1 L-asparaginase [Rufibacter sp. DG15C]
MRSRLTLTSLGLLLCFSLSFCTTKVPSVSTVQPEIQRIMDDQSQAWNRGDLEGFMAHYWKSDSLVFIGKSGPTYGWQKTLENYQKGYPNKDAMGQLKFTLLKTDVLSPETLFVVGKWHLTRTIGDVGGHFSLVFKKINGQWKIIADHSS